VDKNTFQGWESGRRSLTVTRVASILDLRHRLRRLGADPRVLDSIDHATEADYFLSYVLERDPEDIRLDDHPLATWVIKRDFTEVLGWPFTRETPLALRRLPKAPRRGPVASGPFLSDRERDHFFRHLRTAAEVTLSSIGRDQTATALLRRQAYYLCSWSGATESQIWLRRMEPDERHFMPDWDRWSPSWIALGSLAVAQARQGDRELLRFFIKAGVNNYDCHAANLNYWGYWQGEIAPTYSSDGFMAGGLGARGGVRRFSKGSTTVWCPLSPPSIFTCTPCGLSSSAGHGSSRMACPPPHRFVAGSKPSSNRRRSRISLERSLRTSTSQSPFLQSFASRRGQPNA
jgi:hypothetical protein